MATTQPRRTPCWHCRHMLSVDPPSTVVQCGRHGPGQAVCFTRGGGRGCESWEREPGIDDDDWDPPGVPRVTPNAVVTPPAPRSRGRGTDGWWTEPRRPRPPPAPQRPVWSPPTRDPFGGIYLGDE